MCTDPLVSIIIPVYNTQEYLEKAITSILNQTFKKLEIIIINDGSTDKSLSIIEDFSKKDNRISVFTQVNQGQSIARNEGLKHARGKYIYFMDSDDILSSEAIYKCFDKCEKYGLDFVFFDACFLNKNDRSPLINTYQRKSVTDEQVVYKGITILNILLEQRKYSPVPWLNFINLKFLNEINLLFYPGIIHEDQIFTCILYLKAQRVMSIHKDFFQRRLRENSVMTKEFSMKNINCYFIVTNELKKQKTDNPLEAQIIDKYLNIMLNDAIWSSWRLPFKHRFRIAIKCLFKYRDYVSTYNIISLLIKALIKE